MFCPNCGHQVDDGAAFCPSCGKPLHAENAQQDQQYQQNQQYQQYQQGQQNQQAQQFERQVNNAFAYSDGRGGRINRRDLVLPIILSIITCGLYSIYWVICLVNDTNTVAREPNAQSGVVVVLLGLITCNIYMLYWFYTAAGKVNRAKVAHGLPADNNMGLIYVLLSLFGFEIVAMALLQNDLNQIADAQ